MRTYHRIASLATSAGFTARLGLAVWFLILALCAAAQKLHAANITYVVGTCKGNSPYKTIQSALDASPAPDTVEVCPALYPEQVTIHNPVTLEGIDQGNQAQVRLVAPFSGFLTNAAAYNSAAQIFVDHVNGPVNLTNLVLNAQGAGGGPVEINLVGVLYEQSGGTINRVTTDYQLGQNVNGSGIAIQGGSQTPVIVENCSIHDFSVVGIAVYPLGDPEPHVTITNNVVSPGSTAEYGVTAGFDTEPTISANTVNGGYFAISTTAPKGSITNNTVVGAQVGITVGADGPSVAANTVLGAVQFGISVSANMNVSRIENNLITSVNNPGGMGGTGIELNCKTVTSTQVHSNTIMDADYGYGDAPAGFGGDNNYLGVLFKTSTRTGPCPAPEAKAATASADLGRWR